MTYYQTHNVAAISLPAVTLGAVENYPLEDDRAIWSTDLLTNHLVSVSIRIHTAMEGNAHDRVAATLFADQVIEELKTHLVLGNYRLMRFEVVGMDLYFPESETHGAEILAELHTAKVYEQA